MLGCYKLERRPPGVEDYLLLRKLVGWKPAARESAAAALSSSLFSVCVTFEGQVVACGRVIGDGLYFYVQDMMVHPEHQGKKLGKAMMDAVMEFIGGLPAEGTFVGLMAAADVEGFYETYGFVRRSENRPGMYLRRE